MSSAAIVFFRALSADVRLLKLARRSLLGIHLSVQDGKCFWFYLESINPSACVSHRGKTLIEVGKLRKRSASPPSFVHWLVQ
ncbi:hypothetical protein Poly41_03820 [Novipirellula artificiosorum]|uniref:Uncharacterized protein n=1 Tax=Novipirellula artificiosorum TaxID=2528016 RepID=A0A5C6E3R9_9BACT|nr:hypothetical protein Poly41_03820 [Novipirellula artificiosorum]